MGDNSLNQQSTEQQQEYFEQQCLQLEQEIRALEQHLLQLIQQQQSLLVQPVAAEQLQYVVMSGAEMTNEKEVYVVKPSTSVGNEEEKPYLENDLTSLRSLKEYINKKCEENANTIITAMNSIKRSILDDFDKKITDLKNTIIVNCITETSNNIKICEEDLGITFPIKTIEEFLSFEEAITESDEKKQALNNFYRTLIYGEKCIKICIKKIMTATITKDVEIKYSALGRHINGVGKRNFSKTQTYMCINDVLITKFGDTDEYKKLSSILSRWLSAAADREGGRKQRVR